MYTVYAEEAATVAEAVARAVATLGAQNNAYLVFLAYSADAKALTWLNQRFEDINVLTGETIAFVTLFDEVEVVGESKAHRKQYAASAAEWPAAESLPVISADAVLRGMGALDRYMTSGTRVSVPSFARYKSSPGYCQEFARISGLSLSFLPCIIAFDDPLASDEESVAVLSLSDPDETWQDLVTAVDQYARASDVHDQIELTRKMGQAKRSLIATTGLRAECKEREHRMTRSFSRVMDLGSEGQGSAAFELLMNDLRCLASGNQMAVDPGHFEALVEALSKTSTVKEVRAAYVSMDSLRRLDGRSDVDGNDPNFEKAVARDIDRAVHCLTALGLNSGPCPSASTLLEALEDRYSHKFSYLHTYESLQRAALLDLERCEQRENQIRREIDSLNDRLKSVRRVPFVPHLLQVLSRKGAGRPEEGQHLWRRRATAGLSLASALITIIESMPH